MEGSDRHHSVTKLIQLAAEGNRKALDEVVSALYNELRGLAHSRRGQWIGDRTLSTTALVNEAYVRLAEAGDPYWENRAHFLAVVSRAMRQILVDYSRRRSAEKRGGRWDRVTLDNAEEIPPTSASYQFEDFVQLDACLERLEVENAHYCRIVECRFFGGMTIQETAEALDISTTSVKRGWNVARAWLHREMRID